MREAKAQQWVDAALAEYATLREESLRAIDRQHRVLTYGTTALGVLVATGQSRTTTDPTFAAFLLCVVTPVVAVITAVLWLGEVERMLRAGHFVAQRETVLNDYLEGTQRALTWETSLRTKAWRIISAYRPIAFIFVGFAGVATLLGASTVRDVDSGSATPWMAAAGLVTTLYLWGYYVYNAGRVAALGGVQRPAGLFVLLVRRVIVLLRRFKTLRPVAAVIRTHRRLVDRLDGPPHVDRRPPPPPL